MDILARVNWVDVLALIIIIRISYVAFKDGLSHEIFPLVTTVFTLTIALQYYTILGEFLSNGFLKLPVGLANFLTFTALIAVSWVIFKFIKIILDKIIKVKWHAALEKIGGLIVGMVRSFVVVSIILILLSLVPIPYLGKSIRDRSVTGLHFVQMGYDVHEKLSKVFPAVDSPAKK